MYVDIYICIYIYIYIYIQTDRHTNKYIKAGRKLCALSRIPTYRK